MVNKVKVGWHFMMNKNKKYNRKLMKLIENIIKIKANY